MNQIYSHQRRNTTRTGEMSQPLKARFTTPPKIEKVLKKSLAIKKIQDQTALRFHFTHSKCHRENKRRRRLVETWRERNMKESYQEKKVKHEHAKNEH